MAWPVVGPPPLRGFSIAGLLLLVGASLSLHLFAAPVAPSPSPAGAIIVDVKVGAPLGEPILVDVGDEAPILFECRFQGRYLACR